MRVKACTDGQTDEQTERQTECINTFQFCWKVLKICIFLLGESDRRSKLDSNLQICQIGNNQIVNIFINI